MGEPLVEVSQAKDELAIVKKVPTVGRIVGLRTPFLLP